MSCTGTQPLVGAPTSFTYLPNGQNASTVRIGDRIRITYPSGQTTDAEVLIAYADEQPCVHVELVNGTYFECSATALIPTQSNGYVMAQNLTGNAVPVAMRVQLTQAQVTPFWTAVAGVFAMGPMPIMYTYVNERDFWISGDNHCFVLMHG